MEKDIKENSQITSDRRGFLKLAALGTLTGGAVMASSYSASAAKDMSEASGGYLETEHVREYYKTARF